MTKKLFWLFALLLIAGMAPATAQTTTGSWSAIPTFGSTYTDVVETPKRTFALADGFLMSISDSETYIYNRQNKLSDYDITLIRYNFEKGYLFIGYRNGNIDLLYDDDHVVNMPELKDANLSASHEIVNVDFGNDRIALSTKFGIVIIDDEAHEVVESGIYNVEVANALILGDRLMLYTGNKLYISPLSNRHPQLSSFDPVMNGNNQAGMWDKIAKISDNSFIRIATNPANTIMKYTVAGDNTLSGAQLVTGVEGKVFSYGKDFVSVNTSWNQFLVDNEGQYIKINIPTNIRGNASYNTSGASSVWLTGSQGIARYDLSANAPTLLMDWFKPNASPVARPAQLVWSNDGEKLYINHIGRSKVYPELLSVGMHTAVLERDGTIVDLSLPSKSAPRRICIDTDNPSQFYFPYGYNGFDIIDNNGLVAYLKGDTAPFKGDSKTAGTFTIDSDGNLWCIGMANPDQETAMVLPANIRKNGLWETVSESSWKLHPLIFPNRYVTWDCILAFNSKKPYAILTNTQHNGGYIVLSHNGTFIDFTDDTYTDHTSIIDQSGASTTRAAVTCVIEDKNGAFWLGSAEGVFVMSDPAAAMDPNYHLTRPLVARNDGTNFGDYLLATEVIYCIAVDHTNRKWIGTEASGLYLVSEDGSEILEHFTTTNSPLPSNAVYSVSVDPLGSNVYIGTESGLYVYNGTSSPASDDYSDIHVYPNPVRPDYTGWVTITGLMDNSFVKIADAAGNVVYSGRSEGGSMVWDVCNTAGERVRTGVYFILASQNENGNSGSVARITVIN